MTKIITIDDMIKSTKEVAYEEHITPEARAWAGAHHEKMFNAIKSYSGLHAQGSLHHKFPNMYRPSKEMHSKLADYHQEKISNKEKDPHMHRQLAYYHKHMAG